jgi:GNAT superfamily N-acetyltransferase
MIRIEPLGRSERTRWAQLWSEYQIFYAVEIPATVTDATWKRLHDGRIHGLGAWDSSAALVGFVHYLFHEDTWSASSACYLQDLYVDPKVRGSGCGRLLIEAVAAAARAAGANSPYWLTHETNTVARRLYDRVGRNHGFIQYVHAPPIATAPSA